jgi:hypothetical protein
MTSPNTEFADVFPRHDVRGDYSYLSGPAPKKHLPRKLDDDDERDERE